MSRSRRTPSIKPTTNASRKAHTRVKREKSRAARRARQKEQSMRAEVSFDLMMDGEMSFVEGAYRLPGGGWQGFVFTRESSTSVPKVRRARWAGGGTGVRVAWPESLALNRAAVLETLADALGVTHWDEVGGPDSMTLR